MENSALREDFNSTGIGEMPIDLTKEQGLRSVALMLAIRYHTETIIKDADYLQKMIDREEKMKFSNAPDAESWHLKPSTVSAVMHIAREFEAFLLGKPSVITDVKLDGQNIQIGK